MHFPSPVSRDKVISKFPKCITLHACLQMEDWNTQAKVVCKDSANTHQVWDRLKMFKAVVVGDLNVGKTCLINRFLKDIFTRDYKATIGGDFEIESFELSGAPFSLQIWDTDGQEHLKCIASAYYRGVQVEYGNPGGGSLLLFDMADIKTLQGKQWLEETMRENEPGRNQE
ncbi:ras-related protein Rab-36-like [Oncorhynchus tshawytscha]|uniref:ras-related protein Rab-36-like n=1 Tax=Oncorhynchus tshawytscha TaxID=74940 RepID=UPI001C3CE508|nr:ras-related protein Rab-36-like [Oncorhynchus tshawytscha]